MSILNCSDCIYNKTYVCPYLFKEKPKELECGTFRNHNPTKEEVIEMAMCAVCGREEYRYEIENSINKMNENELKKEWERYMIMFSV